MKRYLGIVAIVAAPAIAGALLIGQGGFAGSPFDSEFPLSYPQYAVAGPDNSLYVVDAAMRRVSRIEEDGTLAFSVYGGDRQPGSFFYVDDIAVADDGSLYLKNLVLDNGGMFVLREEILRYSPAGRFEETVYRRTYEEMASTRIQRGEILGLEADDDTIRFFELRDDSLVDYQISAPHYSPQRRGAVALNHARQRIGRISRDGTDGALLTTKEGTVERRGFDGSRHLLYDANDRGEDQPRVVPWEVERDGSDRAVFVDLEGQRIASVAEENTATLETRISRDRIEAAGFPAEDTIFYRLSITGEGGIVTTDDYSVIVEHEGEIERVISAAGLPSSYIFFRWLWWLGLTGSLALFIVGLTLTYTHLLRRRISLIVKQLLVIVPLLLVSIGIITTLIVRDNIDRITDSYVNRVSAMAQSIGGAAPGDLFESIDSQDEYWSDEYREIRTHFHNALNDNRDPWNQDVYFALYRVEDDQLYGFMYQNDEIGMYHPFDWFDDPDSVYRHAWRGRVASELVTDVSGDWLYAVAPVFNSTGEVTGIVEIGTDLFSFELENRALYLRTLTLVGAITAVIMIVLVISTWIVLKTIRILRSGVAAVAEGQWDTHVDIKSNDEVFDLASTFNDMSTSIRNYMEHIEELNVSYRRFVPEQFLTFLGKESVTTTRLGDQVAQEMTILFSDIRSFTELSERMTPKENFDFLNNYLSRVGPYIRNNDGFIDKYIGDAIMALFPRTPDDAVRAAISIKHALRAFNEEQRDSDEVAIDIGIGIHTGTLMVGILGESERMQGTVISDDVNVAARLESLTKQFAAGVLISGESFDRLEETERYLYRRVGKAQVKGRSQALRVYEILDGEPSERRMSKVRTQPELETALEHYTEGNLAAAQRGFEAVLREDPLDSVAAVYRRSCIYYMRNGMPQGWSGVLKLATK